VHGASLILRESPQSQQQLLAHLRLLQWCPAVVSIVSLRRAHHLLISSIQAGPSVPVAIHRYDDVVFRGWPLISCGVRRTDQSLCPVLKPTGELHQPVTVTEIVQDCAANVGPCKGLKRSSEIRDVEPCSADQSETTHLLKVFGILA